ncbi:MAG: aldehyde dehydrogenase family protein, partial [Candidatus Dojkabacteria bacterium]|nr:aldehyde dehydrogenase family protein [Candidatus Dojkabacteria bacterium]
MTFISKNPYNHSINLILNEDSEEVVQLKISNAQTVSNEWKFSDLSTRSEILKKLSNILIDRKKELAELITKEIGQPIKQSINEIEKCALTAQYYAANTEKFLKDEYVQTDALESYISYEPLGIILGIVSWNFPFWMAFRFIIPTISAGNCVLLKHSSNVPMCALAIEDIMTEVGYPKYVFQMLYVKSNHLDNIIADSRINGVSFAGGVYGGSQVAALAGRNIKKTVLELGGSDAFIVLPDADINITSSALIENRFRNAGQACNSPKRVFVHASILEEFLNSLSNKISSLKIGDPLDYETELGPVANEDVLNKLVQQVNDSLQKGAKLVYGGKIYQGGSLFYEPT